MRHASRLTGSLLLAWLAVGAVSQAQAPSVSSPTGTKSFIWTIQGGNTAVYLVGSIHMLTPAYYPLSDTIEKAFERAPTLVEEVDLREMESADTLALMLSKAVYQDGRTLDAVVSKETYGLVAGRLGDAGLPVEPFRSMKPWMVALTLLAIELQKSGFDAGLGLDKYFFDKAQKAGKQIQAFETLAYQVDRFDRMPDRLQEAMLRETLKEIDLLRSSLTTMADAWKAGDSKTLERLLLSSFKDSPEAYERLVAERNRNWLPKIEACLQQSSPCFVVVGAAHLIGPDGLISLLKAKGYRVEQQ